MNLDETNWPEALFQMSERLEELMTTMGFPRTAHVLEVQRAIFRGTFEAELEEKAENPLVTLRKTLKSTGDNYNGEGLPDKRLFYLIFPINSPIASRLWQAGWAVHSQVLLANRGGWFFYEALGLLLEQPECWNAYELGWLIDMAVSYINREY
jgi:hypothetical protein